MIQNNQMKRCPLKRSDNFGAFSFCVYGDSPFENASSTVSYAYDGDQIDDDRLKMEKNYVPFYAVEFFVDPFLLEMLHLLNSSVGSTTLKYAR